MEEIRIRRTSRKERKGRKKNSESNSDCRGVSRYALGWRRGNCVVAKFAQSTQILHDNVAKYGKRNGACRGNPLWLPVRSIHALNDNHSRRG